MAEHRDDSTLVAAANAGKRRRGKRGGAAAKSKAAAADSAQTPTCPHSSGAISAAENDRSDSGMREDTEPPTLSLNNSSRQKPRRGKRGGRKSKEDPDSAKAVHEEPDQLAVQRWSNGSSGQDRSQRRLSGQLRQGDDHCDDHQFTGANSAPLGRRVAGNPITTTLGSDQPYLDTVPRQLQTYFASIEKILNEPTFDSADEMTLFIQNVYKEVGAHSAEIAGDPVCSRILEKLISLSSDYQIRRLMLTFKNRYSALVRHRFASHIIQNVLSRSLEILEREQESGPMPSDEEIDDEQSETEIPSLQELFISLCEELKDQWGGLIANKIASHIVRSILEVASGGILAGDLIKHKADNSERRQPRISNQQRSKRRVPEPIARLLVEISSSILDSLSDEALQVCAADAVANPILQMLVKIEGLGSLIVARLLNIDKMTITRNGFFGELVEHTVGSRLVERILEEAPASAVFDLYVKYFRGKLLTLCDHRVANFVVQRLLVSSGSAAQVQVLLEEILPGFEKLLFNQRAGVVVRALEACVRHSTLYEEATSAICSALHATTSERQRNLINLLLHLQSFEDYASHPRKSYFDIQGAYCVEHLLKFPVAQSRLLTDSFLSTPAEETYHWIFHAVGSRVFEHVLSNPYLPSKASKKILHGLSGKFAEMAQDKYGSRLVERCWSIADISMKERIAEELTKELLALSSNFFGKYLVINFRLDEFNRRRYDWIRRQSGLQKKKHMFDDFKPAEDDHQALRETTASQGDRLWCSLLQNPSERGSIPEVGVTSPLDKTQPKEAKRKKMRDVDLDGLEEVFARAKGKDNDNEPKAAKRAKLGGS
ncbi:armadillo-type protein [Zopfochytrium polystomum]|nr:armadillo-type protein [Zopfochytrium polystomum]